MLINQDVFLLFVRFELSTERPFIDHFLRDNLTHITDRSLTVPEDECALNEIKH
jgi:hypothetical protein